MEGNCLGSSRIEGESEIFLYFGGERIELMFWNAVATMGCNLLDIRRDLKTKEPIFSHSTDSQCLNARIKVMVSTEA